NRISRRARCSGIVIAYYTPPLGFIAKHGLDRRVHERGGEREFQFLYRDTTLCLPVWHEGQLRLAHWGCKRGESRVLPCTGWTWQTSIEEGRWAQWEAEPVDIPATMGFEGGIWFRIRQGICGLLVRAERGLAVVYMVCEAASHSYEIMTRSKRMPVLIGERI